MIRDKAFYRKFFSLYWAIVLQNVVVLSVNLVDNIMLGYDEAALSGATMVNNVQFILQMVASAIGTGVVILSSQYWGQKRAEPIRRLTSMALMCGLVMSLALFLLSSVMPREMLLAFTKKAEYIDEGLKYIRIIRFTFPIFTLTLVIQYALQSVGTVKIAFYIALEALVLNLSLNAILIPRYGVEGAAYATLVSRIASFITAFAYLFLRDAKLNMKPRDLLRTDGVLFKDYLRVMLPVLVVNGLWGVSTALQTVVLGHMEDAAISANSMANTLFSITKTASQGAAAVAGIMIGMAVGTGDIKRVREYAKTMQLMFIIIGVLASAVLFIMRVPILSLYKLPEATKRLANSFILVLCVTNVGTAYQMPTITGIIRGGGDARFGMYNDLITIWGFVVPLSLLAAFRFNWTPVMVMCCLNADQIIKCVAGAIRCNRYKWVKNLTRSEIAGEAAGKVS